MAFAGESHVIIFVVNDSRRTARFACRDQSRHHRRLRRLRFLSAESAAHPLADDDDLIELDAQHLGYQLCTSVGCCVEEWTVICPYSPGIAMQTCDSR